MSYYSKFNMEYHYIVEVQDVTLNGAHPTTSTDGKEFIGNSYKVSPEKLLKVRDNERVILENIVLGLNSFLSTYPGKEKFILNELAYFYNGVLYVPKDLADLKRFKIEDLGELYYGKTFVPVTQTLTDENKQPYTNPYIILAHISEPNS